MKKLMAANWKLHKSPSQTREFFRHFLPQTSGSGGQALGVDCLFFPPASSWEATAESLKGSGLRWGAQNIWFEEKGAFTGEVSAAVLKELGGASCLVGHSERRRLFGESPSWMPKKVAYAQSLGLLPILCVGETLEERNAGRTQEVVLEQVTSGISLANANQSLVIAYEPVWAIGTGQVASSTQVAEAHAMINSHLHEKGFEGVALLYGGSVKPENASELLSLPHVDGFLVGGASLEPESFLKICRA